MSLEPTQTSERVLMPCRSVCRTTLRALLARPRFRPDFHRDTVFLGGTGQSLDNYGIELVPFGSVDSIAEIISTVDITAYDAAYVALAVERDTTAYTADGTLLQDLDGSEYEDTVVHIQSY